MGRRVESPSSINIYFQCPRKYYYQYVLKIPGTSSIHLTRGFVAHEVLENFFRLTPKVLEINFEKNLPIVITSMLEKYWKSHDDEFNSLGLGQDKLDYYFEETKFMLLNWLSQFLKKVKSEMQQNNVSFSEAFAKFTPKTELEYSSEDLKVRGFIDAIEEYDGIVRVMDYKTSKNSKISPEYYLQLGIYAILYELKHGRMPDIVGIYFLKDKEVTLKVDEELVSNAKFKIEQIHASTDSDSLIDYKKNPTPLCKWATGQCDYYDTCFGTKDPMDLKRERYIEKGWDPKF